MKDTLILKRQLADTKKRAQIAANQRDMERRLASEMETTLKQRIAEVESENTELREQLDAVTITR